MTAAAYHAAVRYLFSNANYAGLSAAQYEARQSSRLAPLLAALSDPHRRYTVVHVAGTNGKGSTCAMTAAALSALGFKTGVYSSPHLHSFRERIRVAGSLISQADVVRLVDRLRPLFEQYPALNPFDRITALALQHFHDAQVDVAVIEVGLGGRLDSTNVVTPRVCGIATIGFDHMNVLGNTLSEIAAEKAGIIKPGIPVFSSSIQPDDALAVLRDTARDRGAPFEVASPSPARAVDFQRANAGLAAALVRAAVPDGTAVPDSVLADALAAARWAGRYEWLPWEASLGRARVLVDAGHNKSAIECLANTLAKDPDIVGRPLAFVFGANKDKNVAEMVAVLLRARPDASVVLTRSRHPKAADPAAIASEVADARVIVEADPAAALATAERRATAGGAAATDAVVVGIGSVFVIAELREAWFRVAPALFPEDDFVHAAAGEPDLSR